MITLENYHYIHRIAKRMVPILKKENRFTKIYNREGINEEANNKIKELILLGEPFMIARYGSVESRAIVNYLEQNKKQSDICAIYRYLNGDLNVYWKKHKKFLNQLCTCAGFFPNNDVLLPSFVELILQSSKNLDMLGIWNNLEEFIPNIPESTFLCKREDLEPWFYEEPWSQYLEGKKVLVIHPFEDSIKQQYTKNIGVYLYENQNIMPVFELKTIKAVQTIAGEKSEFETWFDALESMKKQIDNIDFDIAIIGCGAYGFPLASYVKNIGKQAIHLGGVTQLLFGIKGKRWESLENCRKLQADNGKNWIRAKEVPTNYMQIEGGCYW